MCWWTEVHKCLPCQPSIPSPSPFVRECELCGEQNSHFTIVVRYDAKSGLMCERANCHVQAAECEVVMPPMKKAAITCEF